MSSEIDLNAVPAKKERPVFLTVASLLAIGALIALPFIAGEPKGEKMSDLVRFLGRFHPVILHLPIGIFVLIICQEFVAMFSRTSQRSVLPAFLGAASAVVAMLAGFLLYLGGFEGDAELLEDHLWGGLAFACFAVLTFIARLWSMAPGSKQVVYRLVVFASVGVMTYASHDGASITHGKDYLTAYAPDPIRKLIGLEPKEKKEEVPVMPLEAQIVYSDIVQPIFNKRCVQCHKEEKSKGKFRMDTYEYLVKGGKEGEGLEPGNADDSNIVYRAELPEDDEEHMPPDGKKGFESHELAIVKWWINEGADPVATVGQHTISDEIRVALETLNLSVSVEMDDASLDEKGMADLPSEDLVASIEALAKHFPGGLTFESQSSSNLTFTGVSLRKNLTDDLFAKLGPVIPSLISADLSASAITDKSVALLAPAVNLRMIRLSETGITDASIDTLVNLKNLESVNLFGTSVTDTGVKKLGTLPKLKRLYLWQTEVTPEVIGELRKALPEVEIVTGI